MKKLLKGILSLFIVAIVILLVLSYLEKEHGLDVPASGMLQEIKKGWEDFTKSADEFLTESGIKQETAELLEKGAELLKATPEPDEMPQTSPELENEPED